MNTAEVTKSLSEKLGRTQVETRQILDAAVNVLAQAIKNEEGFTYPGVGTFGVKLRPARNGFNPSLKQIVRIPPARAVFYHASTGLKNLVNRQEAADE